MHQTIESKNKALVLGAFDTLFNKRNYAAAERYWSPDYIQHSAHIGPGREGLFDLIKVSGARVTGNRAPLAMKIAILDDYQNVEPTSRLVNTSRGPIVDEASVINALRSHAIAGAAIDVFDQEPLSAQHPFRTMDNVLATPHIGYVTENLYRTFYGDAVTNITAWLDKQAQGKAASVPHILPSPVMRDL